MIFFRLLTLAFILIIGQSCMLTGKMDRIVSEHYATKSLKIPTTAHNIIVHSDSLPWINGYCKSRYNRFFTVPLIIYTYSDEMIQCKINPRIFASVIVNELNALIAQENNPDKLNGKTIEIWINDIPATISHRYTNHFVFFQLVVNSLTLSFTKNEMFNKKGDIRVRYLIRDNSMNVLKQGTLTENVLYQYDFKSTGQRRKYFVQNYLHSFDRELETSSKKIAQSIINEIN